MRLVDLKTELARSLGVPESQVEGILARLTPTIQADDLLASAATGDNAIGGTYVAALAGNYSHIELRNHGNTNCLVAVDSILVAAGTSGIVYLRTGTTGLTSVTAVKHWRDLRKAGVPAAQIRTQQDVALQGTGFITLTNVLANAPILIPTPGLIIGQGDGGAGQSIIVVHSAVNVQLVAVFFWREMPFAR